MQITRSNDSGDFEFYTFVDPAFTTLWYSLFGLSLQDAYVPRPTRIKANVVRRSFEEPSLLELLLLCVGFRWRTNVARLRQPSLKIRRRLYRFRVRESKICFAETVAFRLATDPPRDRGQNVPHRGPSKGATVRGQLHGSATGPWPISWPRSRGQPSHGPFPFCHGLA